MFYDLHIHSALSPCGDNTMTINNIFNMAYIKGLDLIALCDHNSLKQQFYLDKVIHNDILKGRIDYIHGVELQSKENIHILAYFLKNRDLNEIQSWIDEHLPDNKNDVEFYGHQHIFNEEDEVIEEYDRLLIQSLDLSIDEVIEAIHHFGGFVVLAHVLSKRFGAYQVLGKDIESLDYDGIEVTSLKEVKDLKILCPALKDDFIFISSDAHYLEDISEPMYTLDKNKFFTRLEELQWKK